MNPWWRFFILILAVLLMASVNDMAIFFRNILCFAG